MSDQENDREIVRRVPPTMPLTNGRPERHIQLGQQDSLDVTSLPQREQDVLEVEAHRRAIERDDRAQLIQQDLTATAAQLNLYSKAVSDAAAQNTAATITNTKDDHLGRQEVMIGNTDTARTGKLSRSQQGFGDNTKVWILLAIIAGVVVVLVAALRH
ncbi:MAG: hypothetical protein ABSH20_04210 [Tepidisphaeraceae bacterium]|jgi:hypothetical protein